MDKKVREVMFEAENIIFSCNNTSEYKKKLLQLLLNNTDILQKKQTILDNTKLKDAIIKRIDCIEEETVQTSQDCYQKNCPYVEECDFVDFMLHFSDVFLELMQLPPKLKIDMQDIKYQ